MRALVGSFLLAATALTVACGESATGPTVLTRLAVGVIDVGGLTLDSVIEAPPTAVVGESLTVNVSTFGNTCVSAAGSKVVAQDMEVTVTPYDQERRVGGCLDSLERYPRPVLLSFEQPGEATVRVRGRSTDRSGFVTVDRRIVITPRP